jgi:restriction endonuclease Mrr
MITARDFPHSYPEYLSSVLKVFSDGEEHSIGSIRERILAEFPLTSEQMALKRTGYHTTVFVNKVPFAFNRLVFHKAIVRVEPDAYRITDHGHDVLKDHPADARERDL